jgi:hypothetical protein
LGQVDGRLAEAKLKAELAHQRIEALTDGLEGLLGPKFGECAITWLNTKPVASRRREATARWH